MPDFSRWMSAVVIGVLGLAVVSVSGCSRTQLAYNHFDWILLQRIDHYFVLTHPQHTYLEQKITVLHTWHRQQQLPGWVTALRELRARAEDGLSREDLDWIDQTQSGFWRSFVAHSLPDFARFLVTVQPQQVVHLQRTLNDREDFLVQQSRMSEQELKQDILEWLAGLLESWYGDLTETQRRRLAAWVRPDAAWIGLRLRHRRAFQKEFVQLLNNRPRESAVYQWLMDRVVLPGNHHDAHFQQRLDAKWEEWKAIFYRADALMQPHQRQHALDRLDNYIEDFEDLLPKA